MKKILIAAAAAAALSTAAPAPASATASDCPTCTVREAADAVVGVVVHALWPTLRHVQPLIEEIVP